MFIKSLKIHFLKLKLPEQLFVLNSLLLLISFVQTRSKMSDLQLVILEPNKMILFCVVCMERFKGIPMNKCSLKKYEKYITDIRNIKTMKRTFPSKVLQNFNNDKKIVIICIISFYFYQLKLGLGIYFFNCQSCKCGQLSHNYIKHNLGDPNFICTTIALPVVQIYSSTPQESTSSHIHTYSYLYLQKVVIRRFLIFLFDSMGEIV